MTAEIRATICVARGLNFADLAQNLCGVLAEPRRGLRRRHRLAVEHDRGAHAGNLAVRGRGARQFEPHAAMNHLRIGEHLLEIVDRTGRHADGFELFQKLGARQARGQCAQLPDQFGAMREPRFVVDIPLPWRAPARPSTAHSLANWPSLPEAMMMWPSATGNT